MEITRREMILMKIAAGVATYEAQLDDDASPRDIVNKVMTKYAEQPELLEQAFSTLDNVEGGRDWHMECFGTGCHHCEYRGRV